MDKVLASEAGEEEVFSVMAERLMAVAALPAVVVLPLQEGHQKLVAAVVAALEVRDLMPLSQVAEMEELTLALALEEPAAPAISPVQAVQAYRGPAEQAAAAAVILRMRLAELGVLEVLAAAAAAALQLITMSVVQAAWVDTAAEEEAAVSRPQPQDRVEQEALAALRAAVAAELEARR